MLFEIKRQRLFLVENKGRIAEKIFMADMIGVEVGEQDHVNLLRDETQVAQGGRKIGAVFYWMIQIDQHVQFFSPVRGRKLDKRAGWTVIDGSLFRTYFHRSGLHDFYSQHSLFLVQPVVAHSIRWSGFSIASGSDIGEPLSDDTAGRYLP